ncbi:thermonuclease family protein [Halanaerobium saccharolyticum]|uniref:thermonuclease family protein n=1 Tax=Halanaerobium saccharolyticum TaxID=43595 RepID=UPI003FCC4375
MLKKSFTALMALVVIIGGSYFYFNSQQAAEVYIERVIDGDTVETAAGDSIRLLGVDTPEIDWDNNNSEFYAEEARDFTLENLLDQKVVLEYDQEREDNYGRTLAYIYQDGENFNQQLLTEGMATVMIVEPNDKYESEFKKAAAEARKSGKGIWSQVMELDASLPVISYQQAELFRGEVVIVEGKIVNTAATDSVNYLNFSDDYQTTLSLVIFNRNLNKFDYQPAEYILNKRIRVLGEIEFYQGSPQIIVDDPHDILIMD